MFVSLQSSIFSSANKKLVYHFSGSFQFHLMLYLQIDGVRIELNCKTPSWFLETCLMRVAGRWSTCCVVTTQMQKWSLLCEEQTDSQGRRNHRGRAGTVFILLPSTWGSTWRGQGGICWERRKCRNSITSISVVGFWLTGDACFWSLLSSLLLNLCLFGGKRDLSFPSLSSSWITLLHVFNLIFLTLLHRVVRVTWGKVCGSWARLQKGGQWLQKRWALASEFLLPLCSYISFILFSLTCFILFLINCFRLRYLFGHLGSWMQHVGSRAHGHQKLHHSALVAPWHVES